jgi:predicted phage tail protein
MADLIVGAGGGGGGKGGGGSSSGSSQSATVARDNLESRQYARIIDLISEGEIEGFASQRGYTPGTQAWNNAALKDIYFDNTPVLREGANPDATLTRSDLNFEYSAISFRFGIQNQTYLNEIGTSTQEEVVVNVKVQKATPITRSITDVNANGVRVTLSIPALQIFESNGDVLPTSVEFQIQVSYGGGAYQTVIQDTISGRTADLYQRRYRIDLAQAPPVDVRVVRLTDDAPQSGSRTVQNDLFWATYTELIYGKTAFPNSAVVGMTLSAEQFSSIPTRSYRVRGIKVRIPSNATVDSETGRLIYNGVWNGTFQSAKWCSDPAWILWDLLTSKRYGFGDYITSDSLDKWGFFSASSYANELVPNGLGGQEPRFSCNVNIQTAEEAYKLVNDLCSVFRAQPFWSTGSLTLAQDRPTDPAFVFNQSNVTEEGFSYSGSSLKTRHTVAVVSYLDLVTRDIAYEVVEDAKGIQKFGVIKVEVSAFACTSRSQARRVGEWILFSEQNETEVINFKTGLAEGMVVRPGMVVRVADPVRAGRFRAGRVTGGTAQVVTLDRSAEDMFFDGTPALLDFNVVLADGTSQSIGGITGTALNGNTLTLPTSLRLVPSLGAPWVIGTEGLRPQLWRVLGVQEEEDGFNITGLLHIQGKYDFIERDVPIQPRDVTNLDVEPPAPVGLGASDLLYESNGQVYSKVLFSWQTNPFAARFDMRFRVDGGNWTTVATRAPDYEILNASPGRYEFELTALSSGLRRSGTAQFTFVSLGKTAPPATIPDLFIAPIDEHNAELYWPQAVDLDVRVGGQIRVRHTSQIGINATWGRANDIVPAVAGSSTRKIVPLLEGTYFIRAVDSTNNEAAGTASVVVDLPEPQDAQLVQEYREDDDSPPFQGSLTSMFYSAAEGGLVLDSTGLVDDIPDWDLVSNIDYYGDVASAGSYQFASTLDLGAIYDIDLRSILQTRSFEPGNTWDERGGNIDLWDDIDGDDLSAVNASLFVRNTPDNPSGSPTWGSWQPFVNGTTRGRGLQFKMDATSTNPAQNIIVEQLGVITQFQRRTETQRNLSSGAGAYSVTFPKAFYGTPSIGITAQDTDQGDYFTVSSATRTGFTVTFRNSAGSIVSKTFDYQAVGHGREIT